MGAGFHSTAEEKCQNPDSPKWVCTVEESSLPSLNLILFFIFCNCSKIAAFQGHIRKKIAIKLRKVESV